VDIENAAVTYETSTEPTSDGWAGMRVPHPGSYTVGASTVTVTEADVRDGGFADERSGTAHWRMNEDGGRFVFDAVGGNHGRTVAPAWTDGVEGRAMEAKGEGYALVAHDEAVAGAGGLTVAAWIRTGDGEQVVSSPRVVAKGDGGPYGAAVGYHLGLADGDVRGALGDGSTTLALGGGGVDDGSWHHLALTWDGSTGRLFVDGERVDAGGYDGRVTTDRPLAIAAASDGTARLVGAVDEVRYRDEAVDAATVAEWASATAGSDG
jgi:hypothetical protein